MYNCDRKMTMNYSMLFFSSGIVPPYNRDFFAALTTKEDAKNYAGYESESDDE